MKSRLSRLAAAAVACVGLLAAPIASAHNIWLLPSSTVLSKADWITVDAAVANDIFFFNHVPLRLENLVVTAPDGSTLVPQNPHRGKLRSVFDLDLQQTGTYRLAVVNRGVFVSWELDGERKRWRGDPAKLEARIPAGATNLSVTESGGLLETFVTVGKPSALEPSGSGLELVPVTHPNDLVSGEPAEFRMMIDGQPAAGIEVVAVRGGTRYRDSLDEIKATTAADGSFRMEWPAPGMYWLEAELEDDRTTVKQANKRRLRYTATFEVMPE